MGCVLDFQRDLLEFVPAAVDSGQLTCGRGGVPVPALLVDRLTVDLW
ncbi:MAG: hypothetical protein JGK26_28090 [Microcoleus sp. PH2017_27_LUM_O_A]|nr:MULTISPECIES: hypothetical protein [unclassified Microcoleus]MCC3463581.1 hypothetical protein [Microcoleus sp. PH2017_11_PCY_U_A]MCC3562902.1 hypothetical protein [Microcoleus sp. PH2017_27_LUM_O_A]